MPAGIAVKILGDSGPFSSMGKSIGYLLEVADQRLLIDCGSPLFVQVGGHGLRDIDGLIITHCHDDHKRWFSDLALYFKYTPGLGIPLPLLTTDEVLAELQVSTGPAINISLSFDSARVVDLGFDEFVAVTSIGPVASHRIIREDLGDGTTRLVAVDPDGQPADPGRAKIVISPKSGRARLLYVDPDSGRWVEPSNFYALGDPAFYLEGGRAYGAPGHFTIEPINAPVWHGLPTFGLRVSTPDETLVFSSDTHHDTELWKRLTLPATPSRQGLSAQEFANAAVLYGDINEFIEQGWSERRLDTALTAFRDAVTIHDVSAPGSVVHTDYNGLGRTTLDPQRTLLTHSPDRFTSAWMLSNLEKTFRVVGGRFHEEVDGELWPLDGDFYHKQSGRFYVLYRDEQGTHSVYRDDGMLSLHPAQDLVPGELVSRVRVYEDIAGRYLPFLDSVDERYRLRDDGRVERVRVHAAGSLGEIVEDLRPGIVAGHRLLGAATP